MNLNLSPYAACIMDGRTSPEGWLLEQVLPSHTILLRPTHHCSHGQHLEQRLADLLVPRDGLHLPCQVGRRPQVAPRLHDGIPQLDNLFDVHLHIILI